MTDYRLFPNEKEVELEEECKIQLNKVDETINDMKKEKEEHVKNSLKRSPPETLLSFGFVAILIIVPLVTCVSVFQVKNIHGDWSSGFPAAIEGIFAMIIAGVIIYGIGWLVERRSDEAKRKRIIQINDKFEYDVVSVEKKMSKIDNEYRDKILEYKKEFYAESDKRTSKFAGNPVTDEIIQWMAAVIINDINTANRGPQISTVQKGLNFKVTEDEVTTNFGSYVFVEHRISNLADAAETMALAKAIGTGLQTEIMVQFPVDPMGTPARVNAAYTDDGHAALGRITYNSEKVD